MLLFFISIKLKLFRVTQDGTPKKVEKSFSTNNFPILSEHVYYPFSCMLFPYKLCPYKLILYKLLPYNLFSYYLFPYFFFKLVTTPYTPCMDPQNGVP